jgi:hypothetical protein
MVRNNYQQVKFRGPFDTDVKVPRKDAGQGCPNAADAREGKKAATDVRERPKSPKSHRISVNYSEIVNTKIDNLMDGRRIRRLRRRFGSKVSIFQRIIHCNVADNRS